MEALANLFMSFWRCYRKLLEVGENPGQFLWVFSGVPVVIDNRISKHSVEPCNDFVFIANFIAFFQAFYERVLKQFLGVFR